MLQLQRLPTQPQLPSIAGSGNDSKLSSVVLADTADAYPVTAAAGEQRHTGPGRQ